MTFRPVLRPGAQLLRRDATHLQIGTSPRIVIADRPGLLHLLRLLDGVRDVRRIERLAHDVIPELGQDPGPILTELAASGAVVDASTFEHLHRSTWSIGFDADPGCQPIVDAIRHILSVAGLSRLGSSEPDLLIICSRGEAARSRFERASLFGTPHLAVAVDEDRVRMGPFVHPGLTPCVGCHDLHRTAWEPAWPALLHQFGRPSVAMGPTGLAAPTAHAAAVEIAVDILAVVDGRRPRTTGHCLQVGPRHDERMTWSVPFHPGCSCDLLAAA